MDAHLRAGIALYNAGEHHAAHDPWEEIWLDLGTGTDDERLLHGLIQFTAAVYHARNGNASGATGLADGARGYLDGLPDDHRDVNVDTARAALETLATDPAVVERRGPPTLTHGGVAVSPSDLRFETTAVAAAALAEEHGYDTALIASAASFARADIESEAASSPFVTLLFDFVRQPEHRDVVAQRLGEHTDRRQHRDDDVAGLFG